MLFIIMCILVVPALYYPYKLDKVDKERGKGITSIFLFAGILKVLPISFEIRGLLIISLFSLAIFLSKAGLKAAEMEKNEKLNQSEENDISEKEKSH